MAGVGEKAVCKQGVNVEKIGSADRDGVKVVHHVLDGLLVVEDHDRFLAILAESLFAEPYEPLGFKD